MRDERILKVSNGFNFRDIGGYQTSDGSFVRWHKLIRSGYLTDLSSYDLEYLDNYGIDTVIDLRSDNEVRRFPDKIWSSFEYRRIPIFNSDQTESEASLRRIQKLYSSDELAGYYRMMQSYRKFLVDSHAIHAYQDFFRFILKYGEEKTILFHCSAGKDRTGVCSFLLLAALGVSIKQIKSDYMLTNEASQDRISWRVAEARKMHLGSNFVCSVRDLITVRNEYFDQLLGILEYEFGGAVPFLEDEVGLKKDDFIRIKNIYLTKLRN
ncbi:tyrosine-protein phosphatase [Pediococcus claussenii]|uniref:Protein tyrosine/serine phosphatase n=1 Tax=Pediococcus claussenii (strain ATCC BAA-344 / DSM 14800 / JCM 18046 / KCTC 3811 / LMG 21948 / P06) TaxID=701521 RepID=G8PEI2_PEDCP|nr:tyrosine-protein phosphatase [Pediococcus claussenii]AEV95591.1 protein tyrosine/serine phosphatase [Pediococcus claussenii ATCC BAA-344]ANZ69112.1 protein tyrosine phosphatase [Pediococcus claussenii]ANZ70929.1 protein tyrosine phosphatase [Pediococcus claussenii]KRN20176.1 hypothetical protein IV79_GL000842 [Pediococcus claussenii]